LSDWGKFDSLIKTLPKEDQIWFAGNTAKVFDRSVTSQYELVVNPSSGDAFIQSLARVCGILRISGAQVDSTCGYHVHVNASEFNSLAIRNILWIWNTYKDSMAGVLFEAQRLNNSFCKDTTAWLQSTLPILGEIQHPKVLRAALTYIMAHGARFFGTITGSNVASSHQNSGSLNDRKIGELIPGCTDTYGELTPARSLTPVVCWIKDNEIKNISELINRRFDLARNHYNPVRYSTLNLASLFYRGSLEFRVKEGTLDREDILMWPLFCGWLAHTAANQSWTWVKKTTEFCNFRDFMEYTFPNKTRLFPESVTKWAVKKLG
jgi:hypothetical protein